MCCDGGGDAPNPPDPHATAQAQQNAYINSAIANAYLNRIDEVTPFGSVHYREVPWDGQAGAASNPFAGVDASGASHNPRIADWLNQSGVGGGSSHFGVPRMQRIVSLNPAEQRILNQRRRIQQRLLSRINRQTPFTFRDAPAAGFGMLEEARALARRPGPDLSAYRALANRPGPRLDESARQEVQDALYRRQTAELDPRYKQQQIDLETQLANQGVMRGSEAWTKAMDDFSRNKDRAYGDAMDRAITGGGAEQQRLFNMRSTRRQQNLGALQNLYNMQSDRRADRLAAYGNLFGLSQQARNNWMQEQLTRRGLPFQELNALLGRQGVNVPNFQGISPTNVDTPDIAGLMQNDFSNQLGIWGQNQENANALTGNLIGAAGGIAGATASQWGPALAALFGLSSRDFKHDSAPVSDVLPGIDALTIESWRYKPELHDTARHIGPYAEDFKSTFGIGDGRVIHAVDAIGICLKAIQELSAKVKQLEEAQDVGR
jgi:hypothetical protein